MTLNYHHRAIAGAATLALLGAAASPALATNGYFANGYGAGSKGMAGAGVAVPTGVLSLAQNPALGAKVGNTAGFCLTFFAPDRGFDIEEGGPLVSGSETSTNDMFYVPCGGANWQLNEQSSIGIIAFGNGGMNTEYGTNIFSNFAPPGVATTPLGVNLEQLFIGLNYAYKFNEQFSVGFAPIYAVQRFSATGLEPFDNPMFSVDPGKVTNNGDSWSRGWGFNVGVLYEPNEEWDLGISYRSRIWMSEFDRYSGLFAEGGDFDIPATLLIGAAYTPAADPRFTFTAEYQRIYYSQIAAIANESAVIDTPFGADDGPGFGWLDMDIFRVGGIYRHDEKWTFRGGVSYASQFIDDNEVLLNTLAPATIQWHASVGATYQVNDNWQIHGAYTHAFESEVSGRNETTAFGLDMQDIDLRMSQNEFILGASYDW